MRLALVGSPSLAGNALAAQSAADLLLPLVGAVTAVVTDGAPGPGTWALTWATQHARALHVIGVRTSDGANGQRRQLATILRRVTVVVVLWDGDRLGLVRAARLALAQGCTVLLYQWTPTTEQWLLWPPELVRALEEPEEPPPPAV